MASVTIPVISKEYVYFPSILAFNAASPDPADPTSLPVKVAFVASGATPASGDWKAAAWVTWAAGTGATARYLLDPTGQSLATGRYDVWLEVTGATEQPERKVGTLIIT